MTTWTPDELTEVGNADELQIAPARDDGQLRAPVTIWVVNDQLDAAYRTKYDRYGSTYVDPIVTPRAREATLKLVPR